MSGILSRGDDYDPDDAEESPEDRQEPRTQRRGRRADRSQNRNRSRGRNTGRRSLPTVEELIRMLHSLPSLIALGILQPAQASAIRGTVDSMLRALNSGTDRAGSGRGPMPPLDRMRALLDEHPEYADLLEPILGNDFITQIFGGDEEDAADAEYVSDLDPDSDDDSDDDDDNDDTNAEEDPVHDQS